jgi:hypothetical protein
MRACSRLNARHLPSVNDARAVLGMSAKNANGVIMGQEVLKLSPDGKVLMTLGKEGVGGSGTDTFDWPTGVAVAPDGEIFVSDGHSPANPCRCGARRDGTTPTIRAAGSNDNQT